MKRSWSFSCLFVILIASCLVVLGDVRPLIAAETEWAHLSHSQARLIIDHDVIGPEQSLRLGLQIQLQPGWHSYWINPGAAGDAPHLEISVSGRKLVKQGPIQWPVPTLLKEGDLSAYAYEGTFFLPQSLELAGQGNVTVKVHAEWLVCAAICVPEQKDFTLVLPSDSQGVVNPEAVQIFEQAKRHLPSETVFQGEITSENRLVLKSDILSKDTVRRAYFFPFKTGIIDPNAEQVLHVGKGFLTLSLKADPTAGRDISHKTPDGLLTLTDRHNQTVYVTLKTKRGTSSFSSRGYQQLDHHASLGLILLLAFLGGVLLNAMPCVFPVLAMKCLSLVALHGAEQRERRRSAFYYTIGVLGSFVVLSGVMFLLRGLGRAVGWGFQFQSPYFIAAMCWVLLLLALNLSDVFSIGLGKAGSALVTGLDRAGGRQNQKGTRWHDVITGLVAVLLATPCVAPFMGVAVAAALSRPAFTGCIIFIFMGLGLAFPYALLANMPALVRVMPRPGKWMEILKKCLAFPLLASCVWLLWVGVVQNGADFLVPVAGGGVLLALAAWLYGITQKNRILGTHKRLNILNYGIISLCVLVTFCMLVIQVSPAETEKLPVKNSQLPAYPEGWEVFSQERLEQLQKEGKPVFVDMTASWCITCLVNERVALKRPSVLAAFRQYHVTVLVGDWTKKDDKISQYLRQYGRDGVPLYVYYPPLQRADRKNAFVPETGIRLPQVLTPSLIMKTLSRPL